MMPIRLRYNNFYCFLALLSALWVWRSLGDWLFGALLFDGRIVHVWASRSSFSILDAALVIGHVLPEALKLWDNTLGEGVE